MRRDEFLDHLKDVWGPPPPDPGDRSVWLQGLELWAVLPDTVADLVVMEGTIHRTLVEVFGDWLPALEAEVVELFFGRRNQDTFLEAAKESLAQEPWKAQVFGRTPSTRTKLAERLADDVEVNVKLVIIEPGSVEISKRIKEVGCRNARGSYSFSWSTEAQVTLERKAPNKFGLRPI